MKNDMIILIRQELRKNADIKIKKSSQWFFKEEVKFYGLRTPDVKKISRKYWKIVKDKKKKDIFSLCEKLWQSGFMEESLIACDWSYSVHKDYDLKDFIVFEKWLKLYINNWAACDTFCNHTIGAFIEKYPKYVSNFKKWTISKNRWVRRGSAVSLIIPAKKGKFLKEVFEIADSLLLDKEDLVQKGYGWLLKVSSQVNEKKVFDYIMKNKEKMPRTALRYAIEKMPKDLKKKAMAR
jgi:3-methyladenine DNA glycosylase AlkD